MNDVQVLQKQMQELMARVTQLETEQRNKGRIQSFVVTPDNQPDRNLVR